jgi:hypothetical protein
MYRGVSGVVGEGGGMVVVVVVLVLVLVVVGGLGDMTYGLKW